MALWIQSTCMVIIDDFLRYIWTIFLKKKEILIKLPENQRKIHNEKGIGMCPLDPIGVQNSLTASYRSTVCLNISFHINILTYFDDMLMTK